jgi:hypothetical protein
MATIRVRVYAGWQRVWLLGSVLWLFTPCWGACAQGNPPVVQTARFAALAQRLHVEVHKSLLSVDLQEADVGEVLALIGRQAGISLVGRPAPGIRISAKFTGVALQDGLQHLLHRAGLSYAIVCTKEVSRTTAVKEVHVLAAVNDRPPLFPRDTTPDIAVYSEEDDQRTSEAVMQAMQEAQSGDGWEAHEIARQLQGLLTWDGEDSNSSEN